MAERPSQEEVDKWHGWFARETNNLAWTLTEQADLSEVQKQEVLLTAYASVYHWSKIGSDANLARGHLLLARVHALRGEGAMALRYAQSAHDFITGTHAEPWERAFAHAAMADAAAAAGERDLHVDHHRRALDIGSTLDEEDRKIFFATFDRVPAPPEEHTP